MSNRINITLNIGMETKFSCFVLKKIDDYAN